MQLGKVKRSRRPGAPSLRHQRGNDDATVRLVAFAVGLDPSALLEMLVHNPPLLGAHRVHLDGLISAQRLLRRPIGTGRKRVPPSLPVPRRVDHNPLAIPQAPERSLVGKQLQRVDRLPPLADQQPVVIAPHNRSSDPIVILDDLNVTVEVQLIENPLDKLPNPLRRHLRPIGNLTHEAQSIGGGRDRLGCLKAPSALSFPTFNRLPLLTQYPKHPRGTAGVVSRVPREAAPGKGGSKPRSGTRLHGRQAVHGNPGNPPRRS